MTHSNKPHLSNMPREEVVIPVIPVNHKFDPHNGSKTEAQRKQNGRKHDPR